MPVTEVNQKNFETEVLKSETPVLADFSAEWCGPCRAMKPMLEELAASEPGCRLVTVDVDREKGLASEYGVTSIPCLVLFRGGREVRRSVGLLSRDALKALAES